MMKSFTLPAVMQTPLYFLCLSLGIVGLPLSSVFSFNPPTPAVVEDQLPSLPGMNTANPDAFLIIYIHIGKRAWATLTSTTLESFMSRFYIPFVFPFIGLKYERRLSFGSGRAIRATRAYTITLLTLNTSFSDGCNNLRKIKNSSTFSPYLNLLPPLLTKEYEQRRERHFMNTELSICFKKWPLCLSPVAVRSYLDSPVQCQLNVMYPIF